MALDASARRRGLSSPPLENPTYGRRWLGDGGYLFDRHGNIRASEIYP